MCVIVVLLRCLYLFTYVRPAGVTVFVRSVFVVNALNSLFLKHDVSCAIRHRQLPVGLQLLKLRRSYFRNCSESLVSTDDIGRWRSERYLEPRDSSVSFRHIFGPLSSVYLEFFAAVKITVIGIRRNIV